MNSWKRLLIIILAIIVIPILHYFSNSLTAHPLEGKPAPGFQLPSLDGQQVELSSHRGKDVVVLDFWATWCPPCRKGLPIIDRLAKEFYGRGVVAYGINNEKLPLVKEFIKEQGIDLTVLTDPSNAVFEKYMVNGIPQTVIIGKDGVIRKVHVGLSFNFEGSLRREINKALTEESPN
ncbi:MAG TPA: TlpA disulfide reductase family protein [Candidatus Hydrogenedentes bacterium]|nr:TlpA disulfide reductase family protein [Candidatus Hydrogenedentota bacterium]